MTPRLKRGERICSRPRSRTRTSSSYRCVTTRSKPSSCATRLLRRERRDARRQRLATGPRTPAVHPESRPLDHLDKRRDGSGPSRSRSTARWWRWNSAAPCLPAPRPRFASPMRVMSTARRSTCSAAPRAWRNGTDRFTRATSPPGSRPAPRTCRPAVAGTRFRESTTATAASARFHSSPPTSP